MFFSLREKLLRFVSILFKKGGWRYFVRLRFTTREHSKVVMVCWLIAATVVGTLYLREPWLGDDLEYWGFAVHFHEPRFGSALDEGFHALRWPVWGVIWLVQHVLPKGLPSYYAQPVIYFTLGAFVIWLWSQKVFGGKSGLAGLAMVVYLFHPLLANVAHRPMPDLSEGVWMALAMLFWWRLLNARSLAEMLGAALVGGLLLQICFANRFTGILILPTMALCTLAVNPLRSWRLLLLVTSFIVFFSAEALVYKLVHGNFWHAFEANASARGRPGTEPVPYWWLPLRFVPVLLEDDVLKVLYTLAAVIGAVWLWRGIHMPALDGVMLKTRRLCVLWTLLLYLGYSCAFQSVDPIRPLIRVGERFIASLAFPMVFLTTAGLHASWVLIRNRFSNVGWVRRLYFALLVGIGVVSLLSYTRKFEFGFNRELQQRIALTAPGTRIASHSGMRDIVALADFDRAKCFVWEVLRGWYERKIDWEEIFLRNDELWMRHKEAWLSRRKRLERHPQDGTFVPVFFAQQNKAILPSQVIALNNYADLYFFDLQPLREKLTQRDYKTTRSVLAVEDFVLDLSPKRRWQYEFALPEASSKSVIGIFYTASGDRLRPFDVVVKFLRQGREVEHRQLLMYFNPTLSADAVFCDVPAGMQKAQLMLRSRHSSGRVYFQKMEIITR